MQVECPHCNKEYDLPKKFRRYLCACGESFWFVCDGLMDKSRTEKSRPAWANADYLSTWFTTDLR
jgi:hypothetical protein